MARLGSLATVLALLPLLAAQSAAGQAPATSVTSLTVTPEADNPSDLTDAEYTALLAVRPEAPHYSLEQMASWVCRSPSSFSPTRTAYDATQAFEDTKDAVRAGKKSLDDLVRAEAARQSAVLGMLNGSIPVRHVGGAHFTGKSTSGALTVEDVHFRFGNLGGESIIRVHGVLRNAGTKPQAVPVMTGSAVDRFGMVLAQERISSTDKSQVVPAGGSFPFNVIFHDGPQYTHQVVAPLDRRPTSVTTALAET